MSKKVFLKRSFASVVSSGLLKEPSRSLSEEEEPCGEPGLSILTSSRCCYPYSERSVFKNNNKETSSKPKRRKMSKPVKRRNFIFSSQLRDEKPTDAIVISSDSESEYAPVVNVNQVQEQIFSCNNSEASSSDSDSLPSIGIPETCEKKSSKRSSEMDLCDTVLENINYLIKSGAEKNQTSNDLRPVLCNIEKETVSYLDSDTLQAFFSSSKPETDIHNEEPFSDCYENDPLLPIYKSLSEGIKTKESVQILLQDLSENQLARNIPNIINRNVIFIYSIDKIGHWKNALCDGMGRWNQMGTESTVVNLNDDITSSLKDYGNDSVIKVIRRKYVNHSCPTLHRIVVVLQEPDNFQTLDQMLVQYYFVGEEKNVSVLAHGNSTKPISFKRTKESTRNRIRELCAANKKNKDIFNSVIEEYGGLEHVQSPTDIPRNPKQVANYKNNLKSNSDPVLECSDMAKQQERSSERFVRDVRSAPEFSIFLASDRQLIETEKFCTDDVNFSILGIDTTFNIGQFYVTITTYRNEMFLTDKDVEPVMIGPILIHQRKTFDSYFKLTSSMIQERPSLKHIKVFGTDGDVSLSQACRVCFTEAKHLLCDIHMNDNIKRKLNSLNICGTLHNKILQDIFGFTKGQIKYPGLVDCITTSDFDNRLEELSGEWKSSHQNGKLFLEYFQEHKAALIKECMSADLRSLCGLGYPPQPYTQNANECINAVIKSDIKSSKASMGIDPYECVKIIQKTVNRQENDIKLALIGKGPMKLKKEYQHLMVDENEYWRKTPKQREAIYKRMLTEPLKAKHGEKENADLPGTILSISAKECNIGSIPNKLLQEMFQEAALTIEDDTNIVPVPGTNKMAYFVHDLSNSENRQLKINASTHRITCEAKCHRWNSFRICAHVLALAEKLNMLKEVIEKFKKTNVKVNITRMVNTNMPANRGKKGVKATQIRKGAANKPKTLITNYQTPEALVHISDTINSYSKLKQSTADLTAQQPFEVTSIHGLIKKCYGCDREFSDNNTQPPYDLLLKHSEVRPRYDKDQKKWYIPQNHDLSNAYYHLNIVCVQKVHKTFEWSQAVISVQFQPSVTEEHKHVLRLAGMNVT